MWPYHYKRGGLFLLLAVLNAFNLNIILQYLMTPHDSNMRFCEPIMISHEFDLVEMLLAYEASDFPTFAPILHGSPVKTSFNASEHYPLHGLESDDIWSSKLVPRSYGYVQLGATRRSFMVNSFHEVSHISSLIASGVMMSFPDTDALSSGLQSRSRTPSCGQSATHSALPELSSVHGAMLSRPHFGARRFYQGS
jgi:hypothetical protein